MEKGGMAANPFGGHPRLDKLADEDFFPSEPGHGLEAMLRMSVVEATSSYCFWGLGRNGTTADEFLAAYSYFFTVTDDSSTWPVEARWMETVHERLDCGKRDLKTFEFTEDEVRSMTFPSHYGVAGFSRSMTIDRFRRLLKQKRRWIVEGNLDQIKGYLKDLRAKAASSGLYLKSEVKGRQSLIECLVEPEAESLASFLYPSKPIQVETHRKTFVMPRRDHGRRPWAKVAA